MNEQDRNDAVLELYRTTVRTMLANNKPGVVPNASHRHASIIIEELIRSAKQSFFAYCGKMSCDVWTEAIREQLRLAISRGVDVQIVLTDAVEVPPFLNGRVHILNLENLGDYRGAYESIQHFAVVDGKHLRMEKDPATREAVFAANRPDFAVELEKIFCSLRAVAAA